MAEATVSKDANANAMDVTAPEALSAGELIQLPDGRAGVSAGLAGFASGDPATLLTAGQFTVAKTADVVVLDGGRLFWDRSASSATPVEGTSGDNFYLGVAVGDAAASATTVVVDLNVKQKTWIDLHEDAFDTAVVLTAGAIDLKMRGGSAYGAFSTDAEAQKFDLLSVKSVPVTIPMIFEAIFRVQTACDADVGDLSTGLANATHASDADSITESVFFHQDSGADLNLDAESDDGATEVAATDTTVDIVAGTDVEVWIDARDLTDCHLYVNGVEVLAATTFDISAATGPLKALWHWEKSANDTAGEARISRMIVRTTDVE